DRHPQPDAEDGRLSDAARPPGGSGHRDQALMKGIVGRKLGMTQIFDQETGRVTPVTVIEAGPCPIVQVKTNELDGYEAVQLAFEPVADRKISKGELGHLKKVGLSAHRHLVEFRGTTELTAGESITVETFEPGDPIMVSGIS